jgi:hypothetical protein
MRWFVEISSLGKDAAPAKVCCVEAPQWQPALQKARALSGDEGPLSGFSIELLDDGYRAIDPATRHKFVVRRAPDDAALTDAAPASEPAASAKPAEAPAPSEKPAASEKPAEKGPSPASTMVLGSSAAAAARTEEAAAPSAKMASTMVFGSSPAASARTSDAPKPRGSEIRDEATTVAPAVAAKVAAAVFEPEETVVGAAVEVLFQRSDEPSEKSPLTYREIGYLVEPGTPEDACEALLRERFEQVRAALASAKSGRLVNLAVFDHRFTGKPQRRPLATLTWKDWRGAEPELRFPGRDAPGETPTPLAPLPVVPVEAAAVATPEPEPVAAPKSEAPPVSAARPVSTPPPAAERPRSTPPPANRRSNPPPAGSRVSGDDLLAELFEAFCDLHFLRDSLEGADFIVSLIHEKLPCEVCLVSLFDIDKREFVVVRQNGGRASVLLQRQPDRAAIPLAAHRGRRAVVVRDAASDPRVLDARWKALGVELKSYVAAPVELAGRYLGLIELANPLDGGRFTESDGNALTYIGQQFGEFVGQHGVIVDAESVVPPAAPAPEPAKASKAPASTKSPASKAPASTKAPASKAPASKADGARRR